LLWVLVCLIKLFNMHLNIKRNLCLIFLWFW